VAVEVQKAGTPDLEILFLELIIRNFFDGIKYA
jgi:hypothetical protein